MSMSAPQPLGVRLMGGTGTSPGCWAILFPPHGGRQPKGKSFLLLFLNPALGCCLWLPPLCCALVGQVQGGKKNTGMG